MKKKIAVLLAFLCLFCSPAFVFSACSQQPAESAGIRLEDFESKEYPQDKQFVFFADYPPTSDKNLLQTYKGAGFNAFNLIPWPDAAYNNGFDPESPENCGLTSTLNLLEELEMDAYIWGCGTTVVQAPDIGLNDPNKPGLYYPGLDLTEYPAFSGFYVKDEPSSADFGHLGGEVAAFWNETYADSGAYWHVNLFPSYASGEQLGTTAGGGKTAYQNYVDKYVAEVLNHVEGSKGIGMDHYAFKTGGINDMYLYDLMVVAQAAKQTGATLHNCIQAVSGTGWREMQSAAEVRWNYYTSLAFGTKVFEVFAYLDDLNQGFHCMVGTEKNDMYYYQQEVIAELKKFAHVYLSFDWEGVKTFIGTENEQQANGSFELLEADGRMLQELKGISSVTATQDTLIGQFSDGEDSGFIVVNVTDPVQTKFDVVTLKFEDCSRVIVYQGGEEVKYAISGNTLELPLVAGEGMFVIPQY